MRDHVFLKRLLDRMIYAGVWPCSNEHPYWFWHNIYLRSFFYYYSIFLLTQYTQLLFSTEFTELMACLAVALMYTIIVAKLVALHSKPVEVVIQDILEFERKLFEEYEDPGPKEIYMGFVDFFHKSDIFVLFTGWSTTIIFSCGPPIQDLLSPQNPSFDVLDNTTIVYKPRPLPTVSWLPFDRYKYYYISLFLQEVIVFYAATSGISVHEFYLGVMSCATARLKILHYKIKKIKANGLKFGLKKYGTEVSAIANSVRECAMEHQDVIRIVDNMNEAMSWVMLISFLIYSLQVGINAFWLIVDDAKIMPGIFLSAVISQVFMFNWFANTIILESTELASAVWESDWYDCNESVKNSLYLILFRSQIPLTIKLGPFSVMSNEKAVLNSAYSFITLLLKFYHPD